MAAMLTDAAPSVVDTNSCLLLLEEAATTTQGLRITWNLHLLAWRKGRMPRELAHCGISA